MRQSSQPKPISRAEKNASWADHMKEDHELHILREKIEKDMIDKTRKALMHIDASKPTTRWPDHWKDPVHDEDGG